MISESKNPVPGAGCFSCTCCGDCCTGSQLIRLNPDDLELLGQFTGLPDRDSLQKAGLISAPQDNDPRPILRFRRRPIRQCPFLENRIEADNSYRGLCQLHPHFKPLVCHLAPLARQVELLPNGIERQSWIFIPPVVGCPGVGNGEALSLAAPEHLMVRLQREAEWMRQKFSRS